MTPLVWYFIGWVIFSISFYVYNVYIDKDTRNTKKLIAYRAFISGICSWAGLLFFIALAVVMGAFNLNAWIESKLNK